MPLVMLVIVALATLPPQHSRTSADPPQQPRRGKVCVVNDPGGGDTWPNRLVAAGVTQASRKLRVEAVTLDAAGEAEVIANIESFVAAGDCDLTIGVTVFVGPQMEPFVDQNPGQRFAVLDWAFDEDYANAAEVVFNVDEAAFLAGYVAAAVSESQLVGVYGAMPLPMVTIFMDGYALGVEYYNAQHAAGVEVLGWDPDTQSGWFAGTFVEPLVGWAIGDALMAEGVDVVFPVAALTGLGTMECAQERLDAGDPYAWVIGTDYDWYTYHRQFDRVLLTSVLKNLDRAAFDQIEAVVDGSWVSGEVFQDLANGGVDIAPFHHLMDLVPESIKEDLKAIRQGIIDGSIPTRP